MAVPGNVLCVVSARRVPLAYCVSGGGDPDFDDASLRHRHRVDKEAAGPARVSGRSQRIAMGRATSGLFVSLSCSNALAARPTSVPPAADRVSRVGEPSRRRHPRRGRGCRVLRDCAVRTHGRRTGAFRQLRCIRGGDAADTTRYPPVDDDAGCDRANARKRCRDSDSTRSLHSSLPRSLPVARNRCRPLPLRRARCSRTNRSKR